MKPLLRRSLDHVVTRLAWPGPTLFDRLRDEVFALLTTTMVIGVVLRDFLRGSLPEASDRTGKSLPDR